VDKRANESDTWNPYSTRSALDNNSRELRTLAASLFAVGTLLARNKEDLDVVDPKGHLIEPTPFLPPMREPPAQQ
jgi:hypothetical protein